MELLLAADAVTAVLVSWYKPLLLVATFVPWAWLISSKLDKDARFYYLNHQMWNGIHLAAGVAALAAGIFIPIFWLGWPAAIVILLTPLLVYWKIRNASVPEGEEFQLTGQTLSAAMAARRQQRAARAATITFLGKDGAAGVIPDKEDPMFQIHLLAEDLLGGAKAARASKLELAVSSKGGSVAQTVDGIRYKRDPIPPDAGTRLVDYIKQQAGLDVNDRRRRQVGTFKMRSGTAESVVTLTTAGSSSGQTMRLDFDRTESRIKPFDAIGLHPSQMEALRKLDESHERHGVVLMGAPPGHGLTTACYSFINRHDAYTSNIKTLELEIETQIDGVDHVAWDPDNPNIDYATNLQSILRRDPDIVLIADVKDSETARVATEPGMNGPLIYVPQHIATISDQIREWISRVGDVRQAVKALRVVTNQRLLRTLCPNCRQAFQPTAEQLRKLNLPANKVSQLYRASGKVQVKNKIEDCPVCGGSGYLGQTAAFEVMVIDDESRKLLQAGDLKGARALARRNKMIYLQEAALTKVVNGETTIEEVIRVTAPPQAQPRPAEGGASPPQAA